MLLQRRLVDFSSERSTGATVETFKEHYGITLSASVINKVTRQIGKEAKELNEDPAGRRDWYERQRRHLKAGKADVVINELTKISRE